MHYHTEVDDFPKAAHSEVVYSSHSDLLMIFQDSPNFGNFGMCHHKISVYRLLKK